MEKQELKTNEAIESTGLLELCIDRDHITITVDRFAELITKEVQLDMARNIYFSSSSYNTQEKLGFLFGPLPEEGEDNA